MQNDKNPFMPFVEDFEEEAERFLQKYCKEVLDKPQATPIWDIAKKQMNLDIVTTEILSPDGSIQGAIAFSSGIIDIYDQSTAKFIGYEVTCPTVFLDSDILNLGRANNTLAHECYHWYKHRAYFRYQSTHSLNASFAVRCLTTGPRDCNEHWSDVEKMEWQARIVAPRILMPRRTVQMLLSKRLNNTQNRSVRLSMLESVVEEIATTYKVSRQSASIRVSELGYTEASKPPTGDTAIVDHQYYSNSMETHLHQQPIDIVSAFQLYRSNELLKLTLDTSTFCYAEGYFVLRDEKYVLSKDNSLLLTEYAKSHLSECTLDFSYKIVCTQPDTFDSHMRRSSIPEYKKLPSYDSNTQNLDEYNKALSKKLEDVKIEFQKQEDRKKGIKETTSERMSKYMDNAHWNSTIFQEKTLLSPMDYSRVNNKDKNHKFKVPAYTAMAVGLELTLHETEDALRLSGLGYDQNDMTDNAYMFILSSFHGCPIDECNMVLERLGVKPLGTKSKE